MKMVLLTRLYTQASFAQIQFPASGYLDNISITAFAAGGTTSADNAWILSFGKLNTDAQTGLLPTDNTVIALNSSGNVIHVMSSDFQRPVAAGVDDISEEFFYRHPQGMRVRKDTIYTLFIDFSTGTPIDGDTFFFITASYTPYKNSEFEMRYTFDDVDSTSENYQKKYLIPTSLRDCYLEYEWYVDNASEVSAFLDLRILRRDQNIRSDNMAGVGVIDTDTAAAGEVQTPGIGDHILITSAGSGLARGTGIIPIKDIIRAGDAIISDMLAIKGSLTGLLLTVKLVGKTLYSKKRYKTIYHVGGNVALGNIGVSRSV